MAIEINPFWMNDRRKNDSMEFVDQLDDDRIEILTFPCGYLTYIHIVK